MFGEAFKRRYALTDGGVRNAKRGCAWTVVANLVAMGGIGFVYLMMSQFMDALAGDGPLPGEFFWPYLAALVAFLALFLFVHVKQYEATYSAVYAEVEATRLTLAEKLRKLPMSFFGKRDLADLTDTLMGDVKSLEHVWSHVLGYLYGSYFSTAIIFVACLFLDWRLTVAALWSVPVAFGLLFGLRRAFMRKSTALRARGLAVGDGLQEMLENVREIRATNQEGRYLDGLFAKIDGFERETVGAEVAVGLAVNGASAIMRLGMATCVLVGAGLIMSGQIGFMTLFAFLLVVTRVYAPFDQSLALIAETFATSESAARLQAIYDEPVAGGGEEFDPAGYDIAFEDVRFSYELKGSIPFGSETLRGVSFTAREGEVTALVGPSGSGKSTCARLAARLYDYGSGAITVGGVDVKSVDPEVLMGAFSMVFQDVTLFDDTVMENIRLGKHGATDEEVLAAAAAANCDEFVSEMPDGYATPIGENGARLSGGERQRISIARALLKDAPVVLLDEATASLDVENETKVQGALSRLLAGKTVLVIAHRMRTVEAADHVVVLDEGRVVEEGAPADLLAREDGAFARMAQLQSASANWSL